MEDLAGWIALAATCIAAVMTAANLGARVTGWGFAVFSVGAAAWIVVGLASGQTQLLWSNVFLLAVDVLGVWRWLGLRARSQDASRAEQAASQRRPGETLFAVASLDGMAVRARDGAVLGHVVDALSACESGRIAFLIVQEGGVAGVGATLRRLPWSQARVCGEAVETRLDPPGFSQLAEAARDAA